MATSAAVAAWIRGSRALQPPQTIAIFCYVQDGLVHVAVPFDMKQFPTEDLPTVRDLVAAEFDKAYERGPNDAD